MGGYPEFLLRDDSFAGGTAGLGQPYDRERGWPHGDWEDPIFGPIGFFVKKLHARVFLW